MRSFRAKLCITFLLIAGVVGIGQSDSRPWREWRVYYLDLDTGSRQMSMYEVFSPEDAITKFRADHGPDVLVTCMAMASYNYCIERIDF